MPQGRRKQGALRAARGGAGNLGVQRGIHRGGHRLGGEHRLRPERGQRRHGRLEQPQPRRIVVGRDLALARQRDVEHGRLWPRHVRLQPGVELHAVTGSIHGRSNLCARVGITRIEGGLPGSARAFSVVQSHPQLAGLEQELQLRRRDPLQQRTCSVLAFPVRQRLDRAQAPAKGLDLRVRRGSVAVGKRAGDAGTFGETANCRPPHRMRGQAEQQTGRLVAQRRFLLCRLLQRRHHLCPSIAASAADSRAASRATRNSGRRSRSRYGSSAARTRAAGRRAVRRRTRPWPREAQHLEPPAVEPMRRHRRSGRFSSSASCAARWAPARYSRNCGCEKRTAAPRPYPMSRRAGAGCASQAVDDGSARGASAGTVARARRAARAPSRSPSPDLRFPAEAAQRV